MNHLPPCNEKCYNKCPRCVYIEKVLNNNDPDGKYEELLNDYVDAIQRHINNYKEIEIRENLNFLEKLENIDKGLLSTIQEQPEINNEEDSTKTFIEVNHKFPFENELYE